MIPGEPGIITSGRPGVPLGVCTGLGCQGDSLWTRVLPAYRPLRVGNLSGRSVAGAKDREGRLRPERNHRGHGERDDGDTPTHVFLLLQT